MERDEIWNQTYMENRREELGWYESTPEPSLSLIKKYVLDKKKKILDAGCGESTLIQALIDNGFQDIEGIDLSSQAIEFLKKNLNRTHDSEVFLRAGDLTKNLNFEKKGILWHDRAVFHFLQDAVSKEMYKLNLKKFLEKDGIFIISCFSKENEAEKCNGFPVQKYTADEVKSFFEDSFQLEETFSYDYVMPWGDTRNYVYVVFSKKN